jgi:hypothetical protein
MIMIEAVIKPNRLDAVKTALVEKGILGGNAVEAKDLANSGGTVERYRGPKLDAGFVPKVLLKVCVKPEDKEVAPRRNCSCGRCRRQWRGWRWKGVRLSNGRGLPCPHR